MPTPRDRETAELLDELESTLEALRDELDGRDGRRHRGRRRPPTPLDLLRFTERHAIPTLVATLEATVEALELVREVLRLVDPERAGERGRVEGADDRPGRVGRSAVAGAERVLADLRRALAAEELPDDEAARSLVSEARELSEEVETRLREARERSDATRRSSGESDCGVPIDVTAGGGESDETEEDGGGRGSGEPAENGGGKGDEPRGADDAGVDVDAELESIRDEVRGDQDETR